MKTYNFKLGGKTYTGTREQLEQMIYEIDNGLASAIQDLSNQKKSIIRKIIQDSLDSQ